MNFNDVIEYCFKVTWQITKVTFTIIFRFLQYMLRNPVRRKYLFIVSGIMVGVYFLVSIFAGIIYFLEGILNQLASLQVQQALPVLAIAIGLTICGVLAYIFFKKPFRQPPNPRRKVLSNQNKALDPDSIILTDSSTDVDLFDSIKIIKQPTEKQEIKDGTFISIEL